jgi:hypothetical protein
VAPAIGAATPKAPRLTRPPRRPTAAWADRAGSVCLRGHDRTADLLDEVFYTSSSYSQRQLIMRVLTRGLRIESAVQRRLRALRPRPATDRAQIALALRMMRRELAGDRRTIAALRRRWRPAVLVRQLQSDAAVDERLRVVFLGLGASGCASYFDPDGY